ncbi:hypothetical protein [Streptomyces virginiae]|uniref:hypothetical protein n=1 Tax=Streptomyces virginiae TaxID=1961 RepID=UPI00224CA6FF|nr:hypothetical protein [Streptomyces virginiae]MCX4960057.1 hypothetical protein [Streptomyces virginiae]
MDMPGLRALCALLLLAPALGACSLPPSFGSCKRTGPYLAELTKVPVLELRPDRAAPLGGEAGPHAGCTEESGVAWLSAERLYAYSGSQEEVLEYYDRAAPKVGWRPARDHHLEPDDQRPRFCFESRGRPSVTLGFHTAQQLREAYGVDPGPETDATGPRIWFSVRTSAQNDGSSFGC